MSRVAGDAHPTRATLIGWMRLNLALGVALFSLASGIMGAAIKATVDIVNTRHQLAELDARLDRFDKLAERRQAQWDDQARTNADIDRRLVRLEARAR